MYKLKHFLFGYDYIAWKNSCDRGIARVITLGDGKVAYFRYKITDVIDIIEKPEQVYCLTCNPRKYFTDYDKTN